MAAIPGRYRLGSVGSEWKAVDLPRTAGVEATLYPHVARWAKNTLRCWEVAIDTGPTIGRLDVVGIRDFGGGDLASRSEVVAIEVKRAGCADLSHGSTNRIEDSAYEFMKALNGWSFGIDPSDGGLWTSCQ
jgi:hypothetical protein